MIIVLKLRCCSSNSTFAPQFWQGASKDAQCPSCTLFFYHFSGWAMTINWSFFCQTNIMWDMFSYEEHTLAFFVQNSIWEKIECWCASCLPTCKEQVTGCVLAWSLAQWTLNFELPSPSESNTFKVSSLLYTPCPIKHQVRNLVKSYLSQGPGLSPTQKSDTSLVSSLYILEAVLHFRSVLHKAAVAAHHLTLPLMLWYCTVGPAYFP